MTASQLIDSLQLEPLPVEGGYFRENYRSDEIIDKTQFSTNYQENKALYTSIYYLLTPETKSALHLLPTDEIFHFYLGDPVTMLNLFDDGSGKAITLGNDILNGDRIQYKVPANTWQGSILKPDGKFALMGTTMAPGFDFSDFQGADKESLLRRYPKYEVLIRQLTS